MLDVSRRKRSPQRVAAGSRRWGELPVGTDYLERWPEAVAFWLLSSLTHSLTWNTEVHSFLRCLMGL